MPGFPGVWKLPLLRLPSRDGSPSLALLSLFLSFIYFVLPPFEDNGLLFWAPDDLSWRSEVVLWSLLCIQLFFRWICRGESGLPVLFLHHLGLSLLAILWNSAFKWVYLSFSPLPFASLLFIAMCKASSDNHLAFLHWDIRVLTLHLVGVIMISRCCKKIPLFFRHV